MRTLWAGMLISSAPLPLFACTAVLDPSPSELSALVGGTIYGSPTEEPIHDGVIVVRDGVIDAVGSRSAVAVPASAKVLDCSGLTIAAGFWNSHVHFFELEYADAATIPAPRLARQLEDMVTRFGFTSVFDTGSMWQNTRRLRDRIESTEVPGPRIRTTGEPLIARGAMPPESFLRSRGFMSFPVPEIARDEQATAATRQLLAQGVDGIKVHLQPPPHHPPLPESAIRAAVDEAHRAAKPVFVHPDKGADVLAAVRSGVDVVAHTTPGSGPWDETILAAMHERRVALTPTLALWSGIDRQDRSTTKRRLTDTAVGQLRAWAATGGTVLFGTDLGAVDYDPSEEYALMAEAGMGFRQILASLTTAPAEQFGASKRLGRIATGLQADLVVLKADPAEDLAALADVQFTLRAGRIIYAGDDTP